MVFSETFGQWLTHKRKDTGLSQAELARRAQMARATVSLYEKDGIQQPRLRQLEKIADVLGIGQDEMRSAFAALAINPEGGAGDSFEIIKGVHVRFDLRKANLTAAQRDEIVGVFQLVLKGIKKK